KGHASRCRSDSSNDGGVGVILPAYGTGIRVDGRHPTCLGGIPLPTTAEQELPGLELDLIGLEGCTPVDRAHDNLFRQMIVRGTIPFDATRRPRAAKDASRVRCLFGDLYGRHRGLEHL